MNNKPIGRGLIRFAAFAGSNTFLLASALGLHGCMENPGPDHWLHGNHDYRIVANAQYAGEPVLKLSVKKDSGLVSLRIASMAREPIDSAAFLLQFADYTSYSGPGLYHRISKLDVIIRIANLQPGAVLDYGAISSDMDLGNIHPVASLIQFADGAPRGHRLGGVYSGNYSLVDTAGYRYTGPLKGIITADGDYQFLMDMTSGSGIRGDMHGRLDTAGQGDGVLHAESRGGANYPTSLPTPLTLVSGALKGTFRSPENAAWFDSLGTAMKEESLISQVIP
jgi:hypothetical protein